MLVVEILEKIKACFSLKQYVLIYKDIDKIF